MPFKKKKAMGVLMPSIHIGGGENATLFVIKHANPELYAWKLVLVAGQYVTWNYLWAYAEIVPVYFQGYRYHQGHRDPLPLADAMEILADCDCVIGWELDDTRSKLFNSIPGIKIHWIFRHDDNHWRYVRDDHVLLTCSESCIPDFGDGHAQRVTVIPSHVDLAHCHATRTREDIRREWGVDDQIVVGYLGRMDRNKNIPAIARAVAGQSKITAICYGARSGDCSEVEQEIKGITDGNFRWFDPILNVGNVLRGMDAMILPSYSEVFSLSLLEAWASGVPVVCTNVGEVPALQKKFGRLCSLIEPTSSGKDIRLAIMKAISDCESMARAQQMVFDNFSPGIVSRQWTSFFADVFAKCEQCRPERRNV